MDALNCIILNGFVEETDKELLFGDEDVEFRSPLIGIFTLLVELGAFPSRSQAKKNWKGGEIKDGWSHFFVGKLKRELCIWNPSEGNEDGYYLEYICY